MPYRNPYFKPLLDTLRCKKCGSTNIYTNKNERICRRCGNRETINNKK